MNALLAVFIGGGLGAATRFALASAIDRVAKGSRLEAFPLGILGCNLLGCLLIGFLAGLLEAKNAMHLSPLIITGFLGGFTTFSSFGKDTLDLLQSGQHTHAALNILLSIVLGVIAVLMGLRIAETLR